MDWTTIKLCNTCGAGVPGDLAACQRCGGSDFGAATPGVPGNPRPGKAATAAFTGRGGPQAAKVSSRIIGIDLGTAKSCVAVMQNGRPVVIPGPDGSRLTPSVVGFSAGGEILVGASAKRQAVTNPQNTVHSVMRLIGRHRGELGGEEKALSYQLVGGASELVKIRVRGKDYTPPEISAFIVMYLKKAAEDFLGEPVAKAVIAVPTYFNRSQRQATKDAGTIAGLEVLRIIDEPIAASLAYGLGKKKLEKIAVFDLGGGTLSISILEVGDGVFDVLSNSGDTHLGGDNYDQILCDYMAEEFKKKSGIDIRNDPMALQRLYDAAERAKCELSTLVQTDVNLPFITADASGPRHLQMSISRAKVEELTEHLTERCRGPVIAALKDAAKNRKTPEEFAKDIDEVVLVGGMTRMPSVVAICRGIFKKEPHKGVNPDEAVAIGAAIQAGVLEGQIKDVLVLDVLPLSIGIETLGGIMTKLIERNTRIPTCSAQIFTTAADNQTTVEIHVLEGERATAAENRTLGRFQLVGIPAAARGVPQIEVRFDIDSNGLLSVSAKDLATGKQQSVIIKQPAGAAVSSRISAEDDSAQAAPGTGDAPQSPPVEREDGLPFIARSMEGLFRPVFLWMVGFAFLSLYGAYRFYSGAFKARAGRSGTVIGIALLWIAVAECAVRFVEMRRLPNALAQDGWAKAAARFHRWFGAYTAASIFLIFNMYVFSNPAEMFPQFFGAASVGPLQVLMRGLSGGLYLVSLSMLQFRLHGVCQWLATQSKSHTLETRSRQMARNAAILVAELAGLPVIAAAFGRHSLRGILVGVPFLLLVAFTVYCLGYLLVVLRTAARASIDASGGGVDSSL